MVDQTTSHTFAHLVIPGTHDIEAARLSSAPLRTCGKVALGRVPTLALVRSPFLLIAPPQPAHFALCSILSSTGQSLRAVYQTVS